MIAKKDIRNKTENAFKPSDINGLQTLSCYSYMRREINIEKTKKNKKV